MQGTLEPGVENGERGIGPTPDFRLANAVLELGFYRGRSWVSKTIRWFNWSPYSHVAVRDPSTGLVWEAWERGVSRVDSWGTNHTAGTMVDVLTVQVDPEDRERILAFLNDQVGKVYDFIALLHFVTRRPEYAWEQEKWFCSELVFAAFAAAGIELLARVPAYKVYPAMLSYSPLLASAGSIVTDEVMTRRSEVNPEPFTIHDSPFTLPSPASA